MEISYYEILEIAQSADEESIKKAHRELALEYHPDRSQGGKETEDKFELINEAYEVLGDDEKRAICDRYGKEALEGRTGGSAGFSDFEDIRDIFTSFFGEDFGNRKS